MDVADVAARRPWRDDRGEGMLAWMAPKRGLGQLARVRSVVPVSPRTVAVDHGMTVASAKRGRGPDYGPRLAWEEPFLAALAEGQTIGHACARAHIDPTTVYRRRRKCQPFRQLWKQARARSLPLMREECTRRAVDGTLKPVYHRGTVVGHVREYSDTLLMFLMKSMDPAKYRDHNAVSAVPVTLNVQVVNVGDQPQPTVTDAVSRAPVTLSIIPSPSAQDAS